MRLFVNVYYPVDLNCVHETYADAFKKAGPGLRETVEVEYVGADKMRAHEELKDFTAEGLRAHYPLPAKMPSIHESMELADGHGNSVHAPADPVTVGDLNSNARGTGARKSAGKPDWSQIPWWVFPAIFRAWKDNEVRNMSAGVYRVIELMAEWQRGKNESLDLAAALLLEVIYAPGGRPLNDKTSGDWFPGRGLASTADVLVFGAKKYAKGNWAKGMSWSVCFTCAMSHLLKAFQGEEKDEESGLPHLAHAMCNILFLLAYRDLYPEGDDRLPEFRPSGVTVDRRHD